MKDTINQALHQIAVAREELLSHNLDVLAEADLEDRTAAWR